MRSQTTKVVGFVAIAALAAACGDDGKPDARIPQPPIDAAGPPPADAAPGTPDAGPDAAPAPSFTGSVSIQEVNVNGIPQLGQGVQVSISFTDDLAAKAPSLDTMPGSAEGCKVWEYDTAPFGDAILNEGTVTITTEDGDPAIPPCVHTGTSYACLGGAGAGGDIAVVDAAMGLYSFTNAGITDAATQVGRYINISGAGTATNNGAFPIVSSVASSTVVYVNPGAAAETLPAGATYALVAGVGPIPGAADPGFLEDNDVVTIALTGGTNFEDFSGTIDFPAGGGGAGDDFTLDTASQTTISSIPDDGSEFTIGCDGAGGTCGTAIGSILTITTTDGSTAGLPPYVMPAPATKRVSIRCAAIGATSITVEPEVSAYIMNSGATRIQAVFLRSNLTQGQNTNLPVARYNLVAGHGTIGFTTP
jgi:hypothetical protein